MHSTIAALAMAATITSAVPAPPQALPVNRPSVTFDAQTAPVPLPRESFPQDPGGQAPIVILRPRRPLIVVPPLPRPALIKVQKGNKGAVIGALIGAGVGAILGATGPNRDGNRGDAALFGAFAFGFLGGGIGHAFDFDYIRPDNCGCR